MPDLPPRPRFDPLSFLDDDDGPAGNETEAPITLAPVTKPAAQAPDISAAEPIATADDQPPSAAASERSPAPAAPPDPDSARPTAVGMTRASNEQPDIRHVASPMTSGADADDDEPSFDLDAELAMLAAAEADLAVSLASSSARQAIGDNAVSADDIADPSATAEAPAPENEVPGAPDFDESIEFTLFDDEPSDDSEVDPAPAVEAEPEPMRSAAVVAGEVALSAAAAPLGSPIAERPAPWVDVPVADENPAPAAAMSNDEPPIAPDAVVSDNPPPWVDVPVADENPAPAAAMSNDEPKEPAHASEEPIFEPAAASLPAPTAPASMLVMPDFGDDDEDEGPAHLFDLGLAEAPHVFIKDEEEEDAGPVDVGFDFHPDLIEADDDTHAEAGFDLDLSAGTQAAKEILAAGPRNDDPAVVIRLAADVAAEDEAKARAASAAAEAEREARRAAALEVVAPLTNAKAAWARVWDGPLGWNTRPDASLYIAAKVALRMTLGLGLPILLALALSLPFEGGAYASTVFKSNSASTAWVRGPLEYPARQTSFTLDDGNAISVSTIRTFRTLYRDYLIDYNAATVSGDTSSLHNVLTTDLYASVAAEIAGYHAKGQHREIFGVANDPDALDFASAEPGTAPTLVRAQIEVQGNFATGDSTGSILSEQPYYRLDVVYSLQPDGATWLISSLTWTTTLG